MCTSAISLPAISLWDCKLWRCSDSIHSEDGARYCSRPYRDRMQWQPSERTSTLCTLFLARENWRRTMTTACLRYAHNLSTHCASRYMPLMSRFFASSSRPPCSQLIVRPQDDFAGFRGVDRFKKNVSNLGGLTENVDLKITSWDEREDSLKV